MQEEDAYDQTMQGESLGECMDADEEGISVRPVARASSCGVQETFEEKQERKTGSVGDGIDESQGTKEEECDTAMQEELLEEYEEWSTVGLEERPQKTSRAVVPGASVGMAC